MGLGTTIKPNEHVAIDLTGNLLFFPDITVTDSKVRQINALNPDNLPQQQLLDPPAGIIVGNGTYASSGWTVGAGVRFMWTF